jgi:nucleoside-diphosphate-sugar epimerase
VKRALVSGAYGFVASHLARALLERGDAVTVLDLPAPPLSGLALQGIESQVELVEGDLRDARLVGATLEAGEFDVVFHLAAQTLVGPAMADPVATFEANVRGTWTLPARRRPSRRGRLLRQGLRPPPRAALPRGLPAAARLAV